MDLRHDRRADSNEAYPASLGPADATSRLSISTINDYDGSFYPAAASIIKFSFHGSSETGTAPFPSMMGADPWADAKLKQQRK